MAESAHEDMLDEAIRWRIRLRDGDEAEWEAFARWLEADPARSLAYDRAARADREIAPEAVPAPPARRWASAWAAAAALLLLGFATLAWLTSGPSRYEIATGPGERRVAALADGGSVALNGATRLILDRDDPRFAELAAGEATFTIAHDPARPFELVAGGHRLRDAGTTFNVVLDAGRFTVELIEGALIYNPGAAAVPLAAGQTLTIRPGGRPRLARGDPRTMAGWRRGQLSYRGAPLELVTSDLGRSLGVEVAVAPALAARPFTGSIRVEANDAATVAALAATLGEPARRQGDRWLIGRHAAR